MNAKELRIGNWVEWEDDSHGQFQVQEITIDKELGEDFINGGLSVDILPIHLELEWIDKFGFEWYHDNPRLEFFYVLKTGYYPFYIYRERDLTFFYNCNPQNVKLEYVHQLQNLYFALTGEELEIK